jgi:hypothetical protein
VSRVYFISKYQDGGKTRKNRKKTKRIMKKRSKKHRKTSTFGKD